MFSTVLNVLALSETIWTGNPHRDVKHLKLRINDAAIISGTKSKCTALVVQQVYRQIHIFIDVDVTLSHSYKGPVVKSTPAEEKGQLFLDSE